MILEVLRLIKKLDGFIDFTDNVVLALLPFGDLTTGQRLEHEREIIEALIFATAEN